MDGSSLKVFVRDIILTPLKNETAALNITIAFIDFKNGPLRYTIALQSNPPCTVVEILWYCFVRPEAQSSWGTIPDTPSLIENLH